MEFARGCSIDEHARRHVIIFFTLVVSFFYGLVAAVESKRVGKVRCSRISTLVNCEKAASECDVR